MSLLNNVLQDLNKRKSSGENNYQHATIISHFDEKKHAERIKRKRWRHIWLLLLLAFVVFLLVWVPRFKWVHAVMSVSPMSFQVKPDVPVAADATVAEPSAILTSVAISHKDYTTTVNMALDKSVHYQLEHSDNHQTLRLMFAKTSLQSEPLLPVVDPIIKSVSEKETPDGVELIFKVIPETEVQHLELHQGDPAVLMMTLDNHSIPAEEEKIEQIKPVVDPIEEEYQNALNLVTQTRTNAGIDALKQVLIKKPDYLEARTSLAILLLNQQRFDEVDQVLQDGLDQNASYTPFVELKARLLLSIGQTQEALVLLRKHSPSIDTYPNYYALMAAVQQRLGQGDKAAGMYGQLLEVDNTNGRWWFGLAVAFESINNPNAAIDAYKHAMLADDLSPHLRSYAIERIRQLGG